MKKQELVSHLNVYLVILVHYEWSWGRPLSAGTYSYFKIYALPHIFHWSVRQAESGPGALCLTPSALKKYFLPT